VGSCLVLKEAVLVWGGGGKMWCTFLRKCGVDLQYTPNKTLVSQQAAGGIDMRGVKEGGRKK